MHWPETKLTNYYNWIRATDYDDYDYTDLCDNILINLPYDWLTSETTLIWQTSTLLCVVHFRGKKQQVYILWHVMFVHKIKASQKGKSYFSAFLPNVFLKTLTFQVVWWTRLSTNLWMNEKFWMLYHFSTASHFLLGLTYLSILFTEMSFKCKQAHHVKEMG